MSPTRMTTLPGLGVGRHLFFFFSKRPFLVEFGFPRNEASDDYLHAQI